MNSPVSESVRESLQQAIKEAKAADDKIKPGSAAEVLRLQNVIKAKEKELDEVRKEVTALKSTLSSKDRALAQTEQELRLLKERNTTTEGELASMAKELAALKVEKRKVDANLSNLTKRGDKEHMLSGLTPHERIVAAANGGSEGGAFGSVPTSEQMASLQADLRCAKLDGEKAADGIRALENLMRAKDRHINALQRKADEGDTYRIKCGELENRLLEVNRQMDEMRAAARAAAETLRAREADNSRLSSDLAKAKASLDAASEAAARSSAVLKASEVRCMALEQEVGALVGQLARTSVVAQRVAAAEVKAGCKDEGVVHVTRYLEEIRFMGGEVARLQQRVFGLERELAVSDELKERYRAMSQPGGMSPNDSSPCTTPSARSTSRPSSAIRRPVSTPRVRTSLRMSAIVTATSPSAAAVAASPSAAEATTTSPSAAEAESPSAAAAGATASPAGSPTAAPGGASGSSPAVRTSVRRLSKPLPWNTPAKTGVAGAAVGGAGVLARSGAKVGPSVRTSPGATATQRPRATSAGSAAFKGPVSRKSACVQTHSSALGAGRSPGAAAAAVAIAPPATAAADDAVAAVPADGAAPSEAAQASVGTPTAAGSSEGGAGGIASYPLAADFDAGTAGDVGSAEPQVEGAAHVDTGAEETDGAKA